MPRSRIIGHDSIMSLEIVFIIMSRLCQEINSTIPKGNMVEEADALTQFQLHIKH